MSVNVNTASPRLHVYFIISIIDPSQRKKQTIVDDLAKSQSLLNDTPLPWISYEGFFTILYRCRPFSSLSPYLCSNRQD